MASAIAFDVGGTKLSAALVEGSIVRDRAQMSTPSDLACSLLPAMRSLAQAWLGKSLPIGIATTGVVLRGRVTALNPKVLPFPDLFPIQDLVRTEFGTSVVAVNDAQAAAWGESKFGVGRGVDAFAYLTVSTGVGGGLVLGGQLINGREGLAGHFGHVSSRFSAVSCGCGRTGCVETVASGRAIEAAAAEKFGYPMEARAIFDRAAVDTECNRIVLRSASSIAELCADLAAAFDVAVICVGGSVGLNPIFRRHLANVANGYPIAFRPEIAAPDQGPDAGLVGVADLALAVK